MHIWFDNTVLTFFLVNDFKLQWPSERLPTPSWNAMVALPVAGFYILCLLVAEIKGPKTPA